MIIGGVEVLGDISLPALSQLGLPVAVGRRAIVQDHGRVHIIRSEDDATPVLTTHQVPACAHFELTADRLVCLDGPVAVSLEL
jgi:hypothetical protein